MKKINVFILGERLAFFRQEKGLDQGALGKSIDKSRQTMNTWEGKVKIKTDQETGMKLAKALGVELKDLTSVKSPEATKTMDMDVWQVIKLNSEILGLEFKNLWDMIHSMRPEYREKDTTKNGK